MIFTKKIAKAIEFAAEKHAGQTRKGTHTPYISHPYSAFLILSKYTDDEDTLVSMLIHDVPEDVPGVTLREIEREFGANVANIVRFVTKEPYRETVKGKNKPWKEVHAEYYAKIRSANYEAMMVCSADKIHNLMCTLREYKKDGEKFWNRFSVPKKDKIEYYEAVLGVLKNRLPNPIVNEYEITFKEVKALVN